MAQQQPQQSNAAAAAVLVPLLAAGVTTVGLAAGLATAAGVSVVVARAILSMPGALELPQTVPPGPASAAVKASERTYRALYLVSAARRVRAALDGGTNLTDAVRSELPNLKAHLAAQANRRQAALAVDKAAARHGLVLGWKAVMDSRTSAECAAANGKNFEVTRRPAIGWPGAVHPHCRCRPVPAFAGAGMVSEQLRKAA